MSRRLLTALVLSATFACALSCGGPSFDAVRARTVAVGQSRDQVRGAMGDPDHMIKMLDHPKSCVEQWTYGDARRAAFVVDFDGQGRVCDVAFTHRP